MVLWSLLFFTLHLRISLSENCGNTDGQQEVIIADEEEDESSCPLCPSCPSCSSCPSCPACPSCINKVEDIKIIPVSNKKKEKKFYLQDEKVNWFRANQLCLLNGKKLATISDKEEDMKLKMMLRESRRFPEHVWVGGTDLAQEGSFMWMPTGEPFTYTDWLKGYSDPNNYKNNEHCVELILPLSDYRDQRFFWNDWHCSDKFVFACESYE